MKQSKLLWAVLPAAIFSANVATANDVVIYGKVNASMDNLDYDGDDTFADEDEWQLNSNASRLGVKGKYDIMENLKAIYKLEYEVAVDDGKADDDEFKQRNIYGGFTSDWGTLIAGHFDTPFKTSQGKIDMFNDLGADIKQVFQGENREPNIVQYSTPRFDVGLQFNLATMAGESDCDGCGGDDDDSIADHISASLTYDKEHMYLALGMDNDVDGTDAWRAAFQYKVDIVTIGAMYQHAEKADSDDTIDGFAGSRLTTDDLEDADGGVKEQDGWLISLKVKAGPGAFKAQYATSDNETEGDDDFDVDQISIGYDWKLSKQSKVYAMLSNWEEDFTDTEVDMASLGFEHKF
jgi:predicted porin